ncbi:MAG: hypothetical protein GXO69_09465 [Acidobacteria bacterium]|nr:hypothetical protein [Acidobacteriota bacterium]
MGRMKRWIAVAVIAGCFGVGAFAVMCEYASVYYSRYEYYRDNGGSNEMVAAYYMAYTYAMAECNGE